MKFPFVFSILPAFVFISLFHGGGLNAVGTAATPEPGAEEVLVSPDRMKEWNDWKFGLFIHWGPWSQTKIGYIWKIVLEDPPGVREKRFELYRTFDPVQFDPKQWARAAKEAGMKYVVFVTKHHDGFNNYDTALSDLKITAPDCPYAKNPNADLTRAVVEAFRAEGLAIGLYYSHIDWHHPDGRYFARGYWDFHPTLIDRDPAAWQRFVEYEKGQIRELLTNYGKIDIIWFDIFWPYAGHSYEKIAHPQVKKDVLELLAMMKRLQPDIIYNDRGTDVYGAFRTPEQEIPEEEIAGPWEACITITNERGFWYKGDKISAKSPRELVRMLVEIASKGGNFLLNVGPGPDGRLTPGENTGLAGVGEWMKYNSESIYGTTRASLPAQAWGRTTRKGNRLYLHVFDWPDDGRLGIAGLELNVKQAYILSDRRQRQLRVLADPDAKTIIVPSEPANEICSVVVVELDGTAGVEAEKP